MRGRKNFNPPCPVSAGHARHCLMNEARIHHASAHDAIVTCLGEHRLVKFWTAIPCYYEIAQQPTYPLCSKTIPFPLLPRLPASTADLNPNQSTPSPPRFPSTCIRRRIRHASPPLRNHHEAQKSLIVCCSAAAPITLSRPYLCILICLLLFPMWFRPSPYFQVVPLPPPSVPAAPPA